MDGQAGLPTGDGSWISFGKKESAKSEWERGLARVKDP